MCATRINERCHKKGEKRVSQQVTRPAARVNQGNLRLYVTSLKVSDLMTERFYDIERLDPEDPNDRGYQRVLNKARATKLAKYLLDGANKHDAFLPTSIFLATDKDVFFNEATNTISFDIHEVCPFSVVDGQHRLEGLRQAAEKNKDLLDFEVAVNIAVSLPKIAQMCHFLIVNTTQKSVDKSVEQRIFARLSSLVNFEEIPSLPDWIRRIIDREDDKKALRIVDYLNAQEGSAWYGKIEMANRENQKTTTVKQATFVTAIKKYILTANNPAFVLTTEEQQKVLANYWKAIANLLDDDNPSVLYKFNGVELFSRFSTPLFTKLANFGNFKVATIETVLQEVFDNLEGEYAALSHPDWWKSGSVGGASSVNRAGVSQIVRDMTAALHKSGGAAAIQL
jgi:DGQHR domain-containing protein